jgi:N-acetyl-anhydromuramyl-L-alanine amidase AmpD
MALAIVDLRGSLPTTDAYLTRRNPPTLLVAHHSASPASTSIRAIAEYHVGTRGYMGIAYHYCVLADGFVAQTNDDMSVSWHAGCAASHGSDCPDNANTYAIGVCFVGDFTAAPPPEAQLAAGRALVAHLRDKYGNLPVIGHKQAHGCAYTACPGAAFDVAALEPVTETPTLTAARWHAEEATRELEDALAGLDTAVARVRAARARLAEEVTPRLYELEGK